MNRNSTKSNSFTSHVQLIENQVGKDPNSKYHIANSVKLTTSKKLPINKRILYEAPFVKGINKIDDYFINILDVDDVISYDEHDYFLADPYGINIEIIKPKKLYGLDDIYDDIHNKLNQRNCVICCYGPPSVGFRSMLHNIKFNNLKIKFLEPTDVDAEIDPVSLALIEVVTTNRPVVLILDDEVFNKEKLENMLKEIQVHLIHENIKLHVLVRCHFNPYSLRTSHKQAPWYEYELPTLPMNKRGHFINFVLEQMNQPIFDINENMEFRLFANQLFGYQAGHIHTLITHTQSSYGVITLENLRRCCHEHPNLQISSYETRLNPLNWSDIGGYNSVKQLLQTSIQKKLELAVSDTDLKRIPKGVLFHGPPGCSKTMFVRALATECGLNLISITPTDIMSKYLGESEANLSNILTKSLQISPSILFIDEIDTLFPASNKSDNEISKRLLGLLLTFLDGAKKDIRGKVLFIGCTNMKQNLEPALIRRGRIDYTIHIDLPNDEDRREIIKRSKLFSDSVKLISKNTITSLSNEFIDKCHLIELPNNQNEDLKKSNHEEFILYRLVKVTKNLSGAHILGVINNLIIMKEDYSSSQLCLELDELVGAFYESRLANIPVWIRDQLTD